MKKIRVGIVGLGNWGVSHLEAYTSLPHVEVVTVCDPQEEKLEVLAERYQIPDWTPSDTNLWERKDVDLVSIVNPEKDHLQPTLSALNSGKHVVVEKPVSTKAREAQEMWKVATENGRYIFPGHILRFDPRYAQLHSLLGSGEIGNLVSIYLKRARPKSMFRTYQRIHTVFELMAHDIDLAIWYARGKVKSVKTYERSVAGTDSPEVLWACLEFNNGILAVLQSNWMTPDEAGVEIADSAELLGEEGSMNLETVNAGPQLWSKSGRHAYELHHHSHVDGRVTGALRELLNYVCDYIVGQDGSPSRVPFEDAIHGVEVAEAIKESAKTGREIDL